MNIGIDARVLSRPSSGIGRYLISILENVSYSDNENKFYLFSDRNITYTNESTKFKVVVKRGRLFKGKFYSPIWLNLVLPFLLKKHNIKIFFTPNLLSPFKVPRGIKKIITVHDTIFKIDPIFYSFLYRNYLKLLLPYSIKTSDYIITVSNHSKKDIQKYYDVEEEKIKVIYPSVSRELFEYNIPVKDEKQIINKYNLNGKYILYVGVIEKRKNIDIIQQIAEYLDKKNINVEFILVGKLGHYGKNIIKKIESIARGKVRYLSFVSNNELQCIYKNAFLFIFPSLYEGFGYPPLEAMSYGIPVLASNVSSLPEILKDAGILIEPKNYKKFAETIIEILENSNLYKKYQKKSLNRFNQFNNSCKQEKIVEIFNHF
jgi:glycosyltransferase involved in cell wall biosynthesis